MPSLTPVLPQTPLQATAVAWREQGMGKPVRAARGGISGRGECDGVGLGRSTLPSTPQPLAHFPSPSHMGQARG